MGVIPRGKFRKLRKKSEARARPDLTAAAVRRYGDPPKMGTEAKRRKILDAAAFVFAHRGYHNAHISEIIRKAGIARGTFYLYFESKQDILSELLEVLLARLNAAIKKVQFGRKHPPALEQIRANLARTLALLESERDLASILLDRRVTLDPQLERKVEEFTEGVYRMIRSALREGTRMGLVRPCDPDLTARFLLGGLKEIMHRYGVRGGPSRGSGKWVDDFVQLALRGLWTDSTGLTRMKVEFPR
jgi:AcrR family transcriptional regulator